MAILPYITAALVTLAALWLALVAALLWLRPSDLTLRQAAALLPDVLRLTRHLAGDANVPRGVRTRLWLLLGYLILPIDVIPDFIPLVGYLDDVIITLAVLRGVVRRTGPEAVQQHWTGSPQGLRVIYTLVGLTPAS